MSNYAWVKLKGYHNDNEVKKVIKAVQQNRALGEYVCVRICRILEDNMQPSPPARNHAHIDMNDDSARSKKTAKQLKPKSNESVS